MSRKKAKKIKAIDRQLEGVNENPNRRLSVKVLVKTFLTSWDVQALLFFLVALMSLHIYFKAKFNADPLLFMGETQKVEAQVLSSKNAGVSILDKLVMQVDYKFDANGTLYQNRSYLTGWGPKGTIVEIEYLTEDPLRSRVVNGRTTLFGFSFTLAWLVLFLALLNSFRLSIRRIIILKFGVRVGLSFTGIKESQGDSSKSFVHKFKFKTLDDEVVHGSYKSKRHHRGETDKMAFYLSSNPKRHLTLRQFEDKGLAFYDCFEKIDCKQSKSPLLALILPCLFIAILLLAA